MVCCAHSLCHRAYVRSLQKVCFCIHTSCNLRAPWLLFCKWPLQRALLLPWPRQPWGLSPLSLPQKVIENPGSDTPPNGLHRATGCWGSNTATSCFGLVIQKPQTMHTRQRLETSTNRDSIGWFLLPKAVRNPTASIACSRGPTTHL